MTGKAGTNLVGRASTFLRVAVMRDLSKGILLLVMFCVPLMSQTSVPLARRIPKADPAKYRNVLDAKQWRNPYLIVSRDGVAIAGRTPAGQTINSIADELARLPDSAWPYGLVVAVQDISVQTTRDHAVIAKHRKELLESLRKLNIAVELWPSA